MGNFPILGTFLKLFSDMIVVRIIYILGFLWIGRRMYLIERKMLKKGLDIVSAKYGIDNHMSDVTRTLSKMLIKSDTVCVSNILVPEDPAPNQEKKLEIVYFYDGKKNTKEFIEGQVLSKKDLVVENAKNIEM